MQGESGKPEQRFAELRRRLRKNAKGCRPLIVFFLRKIRLSLALFTKGIREKDIREYPIFPPKLAAFQRDVTGTVKKSE